MEKETRRLVNLDRGVSLVEFALVLPFLILIIMGIFDLGFAVYANNTVALAAREGARTAIIVANSDTQICNQVRKVAQALDVTCTISPSPTRSPGNPVSVTVSYLWTPLTPLIGNAIGVGGGFTVSSAATMQVE